MSGLERTLLVFVMLMTSALTGCAADVRTGSEPEEAEELVATDDSQNEVEQATSELLKRWGGDDIFPDRGDPDDGFEHDAGCKDHDGKCEERCDRKKVRKVCFFKTILTGLEEVPVRRTFAFGAAVFKYDSKRHKLDYWLYVANIRNVVAAHLHLGERGTNGPVVAFLAGPFPPGGGFFSGELASGSIGRGDLLGPLEGEPVKTLVQAIAAGDIYVNVHTDDGVAPANTGSGDFAAGEIRGQVKKLGCKIAKRDRDQHDCKPEHADCKDHDCKPEHADCKGHECKPEHADCKDHQCKPEHADCKDHECKPEHADCPDGGHDHGGHEPPPVEMM